MRKLVRWTLPALVGVVGLPLAAAAADQPDTLVIGAGSAPPRLVAPGQVEAVRQAQLAAQASGRITEVLVRSGEMVRQGQVLLRIDSPAAQAAAAEGDAQAGAAAAQAASARADFARSQRLHDKGYISDAAFERARAQLQAVEAQAAASAAHAKAARTSASWEALRAPYDGRVTAVRVAAGDLASPGEPLVSVYAPGAMRVIADVPTDVAGRLATDRPVQLAYQAGACARAPTQVDSWVVVPAVDPRSRSVGVRVEIAAAPDCLPGTLVQVSVPLRGTQSILLVPPAAVIRRGELQAVYVVGTDGRVSLRQIRLGESRADGIEVLAGLDPGERIVRDVTRLRVPAAGRGELP